MQTLKNHSFLVIFLLAITSCKNNTSSATTNTTEKLEVLGNYVSEGYSKRDEGYDWVAVSVTQGESDNINITVGSRTDKKKPTCTFEGKAAILSNGKYEVLYEDTPILFEFTQSDVSISTKNPDDINLLYYFCNGGATLAGTYQKIEGNLDIE